MSDRILTNRVKIDGNALKGNIATLAFDVDIVGEALMADEGMVFRIYSTSPRGSNVEVGTVWRRQNGDENRSFMLTLHTGHGRWFARLKPLTSGDGVYAVIPIDYLNCEDRS
ncbi:hypothetical protein [Ensifer aridi]|uniref:hypothetical protein n=1 Tax=Ensifer aridi TaxID=1708715 RepID=UPI000A11CC1D|nr:hypothetical protein [Ensifer aridi]